MATKEKNIWFNPEYAEPGGYLTKGLDWFADNGWGMTFEPNYDQLWDKDTWRTTVEPSLSNCNDYEIPINLWSLPWVAPGFDPNISYTTGYDLTESYYANLHNDVLLDMIDRWAKPGGSEGEVLTGFWYETGYESAASWLYDTVKAADPNLKIRLGIYDDMWTLRNRAPGNYGAFIDTTQRFNKVDQVDIEVWQMFTLNVQANCIQWMNANYPNMPLGIDSMPFFPPVINATERIWTYNHNDLTETLPSIAESERRYATWLTYLKRLTGRGSFDVLQMEVSAYNDAGPLDNTTNPTVSDYFIEQAKYCASLCLINTETKLTQDMSESGITPYYSGASCCVRPLNTPDTFANTGNEMIMLKNAGSTSASHNITVTGSSATKNYTVTISPTIPTFLGPYPLPTFGSLPTIIYDNTNLYVSIVKDA